MARWPYTRDDPCPECSGWDPGQASTCGHAKWACPSCGRTQCWTHWPYPVSTEEEAVHFLRSATIRTGKACFVRAVTRGPFVRWKIFTSEEDYRSYTRTGKHGR